MPKVSKTAAGFDEAASVGQAQIGQHMWGTEGFHWGIPTGLVFSLMESPEKKGTWMIYIGVAPKKETSRFCHIGMGWNWVTDLWSLRSKSF